MKKLFTLLYIIMAFSAKADYWTQKADFGGTPRFGSFSFVIGNKAYIGSGEDSSFTYKSDFWEYDQSTNIWTQKADFAGASRIYSIGLSEINKGYAGLGTKIIGSNQTIYQDWWEFDPTNNSWAQKANFPGDGLIYPVSFTIGNDGFVGTGQGTGISISNSLWLYNATLDLWYPKSSMPVERMEAIAFSIGNNGYIGSGFNTSGTSFLQDFWEYDYFADAWTQKADMPFSRVDAYSFSVCDKGYFGLGESDSIFNEFPNDFWQYDPMSNQWIQKTNFPVSSSGYARDEGVSLTMGNKGYVGLGGINGWNTGDCYRDFWEYTPDSACTTGIEELSTSNLEFTISPNPAHQYADISWSSAENKNVEIVITTLEGKIVPFVETDNYPSLQQQHEIKINLHTFPKGIYLVQTISNKKISATKKLMVE